MDNQPKWPYMREHIKLFIKLCPCCQKMSVLRTPILTQPFTTASYGPMQVISMDSLGPFPEDSDGNKYVITIIDTFTRFVELYPVKDVTAEFASRALLNFVGRYGCPMRILSDNGSQFVNEAMNSLIHIMGTDYVHTMAYSSEENAIVERAQKEILRHARAMVFSVGASTQWASRLPLIQRILNSTVHASIGVTPVALLHGTQIDLDRGVFLPLDAVLQQRSLSKWSADMIDTQSRLLLLAEKQQRDIDRVHMEVPQVFNNYKRYPANSLVLLGYPKDAVPTKLHTNLAGPYRVISNEGGKYTLYDFTTDKQFEVSVTRLRDYHSNEDSIDPAAIARKDKGEFLVESIQTHVGDLTRKSTLDFKVRWVGCTPREDEWLPWRIIRSCTFI